MLSTTNVHPTFKRDLREGLLFATSWVWGVPFLLAMLFFRPNWFRTFSHWTCLRCFNHQLVRFPMDVCPVCGCNEIEHGPKAIVPLRKWLRDLLKRSPDFLRS